MEWYFWVLGIIGIIWYISFTYRLTTFVVSIMYPNYSSFTFGNTKKYDSFYYTMVVMFFVAILPIAYLVFFILLIFLFFNDTEKRVKLSLDDETAKLLEKFNNPTIKQ